MIKILIVVTTLVGSALDISINEVEKLDQCLDEAPVVLRAVKMVSAVKEAKVECIERTRANENERWKDEVKVALTSDGWEAANKTLTTGRDPGSHRFESGYPQATGGYDRYGYDSQGFDRYGYNRYGFDRYGYNRFGFDREGYDQYGYDRYGFDRYGYDRNGNHRNWAQRQQPGYQPGYQLTHPWRGYRYGRTYSQFCREFPDRPECVRVQPYSPQSVPVPNPGYPVPNPGRPAQP